MILVRLFFTLLILGPIVLGILNLRQYRALSIPKQPPYYTALINSAVLYAIAFNVIFFLQELFLTLGKKAIGLETTLYHNNHSWEGSSELASLMQGSGALAIFILGLICLAWFRVIRNSQSIWKLLVLWLAFHGLIQSVPQVMIAFFDANIDVGQALVGYLDLNQALLVLLSLVSIVATALISMWMSRPLLELAPAELDLSNPKLRLKYIRSIAVGAALLGCLFVIPFRVPPVTQILAPVLLFIFTVPWIWSISARIENIKSIPNSVNEKILWQPLAMLLGLLLFFRIVLAPGVAF